VNFLLSFKTSGRKKFVVEDYEESLEGKNTKEKTKRDVKLLEEFLGKEKNGEREVQTI